MPTILLKLAPYIIGISILTGSYLYVSNLQSKNQQLEEDKATLQHNEKQMIKAYENSIIILQKKSYDEGMNKAQSLQSKTLEKKIDQLNKKRKFDEVNNSTYRTTSF